ncbi:HNH endonuclease signature motif containing protein [Beijerinckia mobilis]|uniref:HNH endonuclease signature motif containing protein n=1 Tax=Beijerinckia mobilis TaxID=231434 RepID=UPI003520045D
MWIDTFGAIPAGYEVHHRDGDKSHNAIDNFELLTKSGHRKHHFCAMPIPAKDWTKPPTIRLCCSACNTQIMRRRRTVHPLCEKCLARTVELRRRNKLVRYCEQCGECFQTRSAHFCSQRCVNLATRGGTRSILPDSRRRA